MARAINKLSAFFVKKHQEPGYYLDGAGLYLQISSSGTKSWIFKFTLNGRTREMGLGPEHTISLADARDLAVAQRKLLREGKDPIIERDNMLAAAKLAISRRVTFDECAHQYIEAHKAEWKNAKHYDQWVSTLAAYVSPHIGALPVSDVDTGLVLKCLEPIWTTKTETAVRLKGRIERILGWATTRGFRSGENPARWKDHLDHLLAAPGKIAKERHYPALPYTDIGAFMAELKKRPGVTSQALEFAILTASRSGEIRGATWGEINFDEALWTIPPERMKMGKEHRVPLSRRAVAILKERQKENSEGYIFPGRGGSIVSDASLNAVIKRMNAEEEAGPRWVEPKTGEGVVQHGFRSTFMDWAAETTDYPKELRDMSLAHAVDDKVEAAYRRGDLYQKRVCIMEDWAAYCSKVHKPGKVVPIRKSTAA